MNDNIDRYEKHYVKRIVKHKTLSASMLRTDFEEFKTFCDEKNTTPSRVVRHLIKLYMKGIIK